MKSRITLIVIIATITVILLGAGLINGKFFKVKTVEVVAEGITEFEESQVKNIAEVTLGQSIFSVDKDKIVNSINASGTFHAEDVVILYPSTVKIIVEKRIPYAIIESDSGYILIDSDCNMIDIVQSTAKYDLPIFTGIRISRYAFGESVETKDPYQRSLILAVIDSLYSNATVDMISTVSLESQSSIYLIASNGKRIDLNEAADIPAKLSHLALDELKNAIFSQENNTITLYKNSFVIS